MGGRGVRQTRIYPSPGHVLREIPNIVDLDLPPPQDVTSWSSMQHPWAAWNAYPRMEDPEVAEHILAHLRATPAPDYPPPAHQLGVTPHSAWRWGREGGWKRTPPYRESGVRRILKRRQDYDLIYSLPPYSPSQITWKAHISDLGVAEGPGTCDTESAGPTKPITEPQAEPKPRREGEDGEGIFLFHSQPPPVPDLRREAPTS